VPYVDLKRCGNVPASYGKFVHDPFMKSLAMQNGKLVKRQLVVSKGTPK
jgi:hypothetical protein